ncbi:hypothetical protein RJ639_046693 [Escallonia herrerae]|uniref:Reverse transcriptase RNase H-like domain-containing protein n=1 Tax=Escallonia herrerae TaxID=1293975 RepID=A0AA89AZ59_9ASTE|nr:hypothetical protein RJ639_046693 [Escallonia herrerae]
MEHSLKPQVSEPKSHGGARYAKELENLLFDMEQYFQAIRVDSEEMKVSMAVMYLIEDAKLWWRKKYAEIEEGHIGSVREYCHAFSTLMLDIGDMFAVDRLFFFMEVLKPWAHTELNRRRVNNLMKTSLLLRAFQMTTLSHRDPIREGIQAVLMVARSQGVKRQTKVGAARAAELQILPPNRRVKLGSRPSHASNSGEPPTDEQPDTQNYEEEDAVGAFPQWCNAVTTQVGNPEEDLSGEKLYTPPKKVGDVPGKGLMYMDIKVNEKAIRAMVDTGATHNYISSTKVERLGLTLEKDTSNFALGGVLIQECHPVAYESRKLNEVERRYTTHEKELLTVVHCLKVWRHYLLGSSFVVRTENTAVSHFLSQSKLTSKQARWQELLAEFNFMLEYRAGSTNNVADALSKRAELDQLALIAMNAIVRADN